ncbi:MAG: putative Ig domain-containing protein, partial [Chthoniobacterales bacterium]
TGNNPPVIGALSAATIPVNTPFALTGSATDADGDTITYDWEEFDLGTSQSTQNPSPSGTNPIFRSYAPTLSPTRYFPSLNYILDNANVPPATNADGYATGEVLPSVARTMTFRLTARDNRAGGGGSNWASTTVTTVATGSAFAVTSPNTSVTFAGGSQQTVTWNVAGTDVNGINCANVKISLSTDGGNTFPTILASSIPNNGSAIVTIPQIATVQGRIKVEAVGNIFFDISDADFTITSNNNAPTLNITGSITVARGTPTATVAIVGTVNDTDGDALTVSVSDLPYRASVTPTLVGNNISLSALVDCGLTTTLTTRTYPITLTVSDSKGALVSGTVNLVVTPNASPTLGAYPNITVPRNNSATSTPAAPAADSNNNLLAGPYSITPTTLPGGGTISINQSTGVVTATTNGTSTLNVATPVRVTVLDSCGAAAIQIFNVTVVSTTPVLQAGTASAPTSESCPPTNSVVDPGETVTVNFPITNVGGGPTSNLVATLQNSGGVTPITTSQNYGAIAANGTVTQAFQFTANGTCGSNITATLQLQDGATNYGSITYTIRLGVLTASTTLFQNFDGVTAPSLPAGWTAVVASGSMTPWTTSTTSPDTSPNSVSATTVTTPSDDRLTSPSVAIPATAPQLSFRHRWNLEEGYDGGILEISINGGAFTDIVAAGGSFVSGGYNETISTQFSSPIAGASAWTGNFNSTYTTTLVNLPATAAGQNAQFRWRLACDSGVSVTGAIWRIDTINLISSSYVCSSCSVAPSITSAPPPSPVVVGKAYTYTFTATGAPTPMFSLTNGSFPPGLSLSTSGVLSGTPNSGGNGSFPNITVTASNGVLPNAPQTFSLAAVTSAANYIAGFGLTGSDAALLYDYDGDGISNLMEYALGLDPTIATPNGLPVVTLKDYSGTQYLSMTFARSTLATDLTYTVQGSSDLITWTDLATSVGGAALSGAGLVSETGSAPTMTDEVRDTVPFVPANPQRFLRLKVTSP